MVGQSKFEIAVVWTKIVIVWTDVSILWVPEAQVFIRPADAYPHLLCLQLARSPRASFSAESLTLVCGLEWCHFHL